MRLPAFCTAILAYVVIGHPSPAVAQVDQQRAAEFFKEAQPLCVRSTGWPPRRGGESLVRTFAYASGPAYGILLDAASPGWPRTGARKRRSGRAVDACARVQPVADAAAAAGVPLCCRVLQNVPACASAG